jgi:hypothetical protein
MTPSQPTCLPLELGGTGILPVRAFSLWQQTAP